MKKPTTAEDLIRDYVQNLRVGIILYGEAMKKGKTVWPITEDEMVMSIKVLMLRIKRLVTPVTK